MGLGMALLGDKAQQIPQLPAEQPGWFFKHVQLGQQVPLAQMLATQVAHHHIPIDHSLASNIYKRAIPGHTHTALERYQKSCILGNLTTD
jgi:hypothetical protein